MHHHAPPLCTNVFRLLVPTASSRGLKGRLEPWWSLPSNAIVAGGFTKRAASSDSKRVFQSASENKRSRSSGASWNTTPADWHGYKVDSRREWAELVLLNQSGVIPVPGPMTAARGQTACSLLMTPFDNVCFWPQFKLQSKANTPQKVSILSASSSVLTRTQVNTSTFKCGGTPPAGSAHWPDGCGGWVEGVSPLTPQCQCAI